MRACRTDAFHPKEEWAGAFIEHWHAKRAELGTEGNAYFQQSPDAASTQLRDLARRIRRCCLVDPEFARRTTAHQLGQVLRGQEDDRSRREQLALLPYYARDLRPAAQQLFIERPDHWEYQLFAAVFSDEIALHAPLLRDYERGTTWGPRRKIEDALQLTDWLQVAMSEAEAFGSNIEALLKAANAAFGPAGMPGDAEAIIDSARKMGDAHRRGIEWVLEIRRCVSSDPLIEKALLQSERFLEDFIRQVREFSETFNASLDSTLTALRNGDAGPHRIELTLHLTVPEGLADEVGATLAAIGAALLQMT